MTHEPVPLARIFAELLPFVGARSDAVIFGAQAVNAYSEPARMTADLDLLSTGAAALAEDVRAFMANQFHIAARTREVSPGAFRVYQLREPTNRHLVDVRQVDLLPPHRLVDGVRVIEPAHLAAMKAISMVARRGRDKELSDRLDLHRLLRAFPLLRVEAGEVAALLRDMTADAQVLSAWTEVVRHPLAADDDAW